LVPSAIAGVLGIKLASDTISGETLARSIGRRKVLLVLDNCEHVIDAVAELVEVLVQLCPQAAVLATSGEVLRIGGEHIYRVAPLDVPATDASSDLLDYSAVELFVSRLKALDVGYPPASHELPLIASICQQLDGIPLAIEFAAARAATLGLREVASGLSDRFMLLTSGRRTALPRHQTLRAALDWSYELLSETERELLRRLAIFAGPFSLKAASAVAPETMTANEVAGGVADLLSKSLVVRSADPDPPEFRLLETTRAYALDRLHKSDALADVAQRYADFLLEILAHVDEKRQSLPCSPVRRSRKSGLRLRFGSAADCSWPRLLPHD
jgi:predicted ATPase